MDETKMETKIYNVIAYERERPRFQVHRLRHLRQGLPHGGSGDRREVIS